MTKTIALTSALTLALGAAVLMLPGPASAQTSPWCTGTVAITSGGYATSYNYTPPGPDERSAGRGRPGSRPYLSPVGAGPGGVADTCEILSTAGGLVVQNGGDTTGWRDGENAQHESQGQGVAGGHGPAGG